jgi:hypothetical protein
LWMATIVGLVSPEPMRARIRQSGFIGYLVPSGCGRQPPDPSCGTSPSGHDLPGGAEQLQQAVAWRTSQNTQCCVGSADLGCFFPG